MSVRTNREARERYCPFTMGPAVEPAHCLGSDCLAWRFRVVERDTETGETLTQRRSLALIRGGACPERFALEWSEYGYCGRVGEVA